MDEVVVDGADETTRPNVHYRGSNSHSWGQVE